MKAAVVGLGVIVGTGVETGMGVGDGDGESDGESVGAGDVVGDVVGERVGSGVDVGAGVASACAKTERKAATTDVRTEGGPNQVKEASAASRTATTTTATTTGDGRRTFLRRESSGFRTGERPWDALSKGPCFFIRSPIPPSRSWPGSSACRRRSPC